MRKEEAISPINECSVQQVIITKTCVGQGTDECPYRIRTEVWGLTGERIAAYDPEDHCPITKERKP